MGSNKFGSFPVILNYVGHLPFTTSPDGLAGGWAGRLEETKLRLTQPSLVELGLGLSLAKVLRKFLQSESSRVRRPGSEDQQKF